jgi:hypothetical protein
MGYVPVVITGEAIGRDWSFHIVDTQKEISDVATGMIYGVG